MPKEILKEVADNKAMMDMIQMGKYPFDFVLANTRFDMVVLNEDEVLEVVRTTNGLDVASKFPFIKKETLARALRKVQGDSVSSREVAMNFLGWLPDILVDSLYLEYEKAKQLRDLKIDQILSDLKNGSGSQDQDGTGDGSDNPDQPGSSTSTQ